MADHVISARLSRGALRVPAVGIYFWVIKALSTALGESTSDYLVHVMNPVVAVLLGFCVFTVALLLQFRMRRYIAWAYWLAVVMVGVFGTMAADVVHVGFGVPYLASTSLYLVALAAIFATWRRVENTLSMHSINTVARELFYWAAVVATFATGTAAGDLAAVTLDLGYLLSGVLFAAAIAIPVIGYWRLGWNPVLTFWSAYVLTRPLGASFADWFAKPVPDGGIGVGDGPVSAALAIGIGVLVAYLACTGTDIQPENRVPATQPPAPPR